MAIINLEPQIYEYTEGQAANTIVGTHSIFYSGGTVTLSGWAMAGGPGVTTSMNYKVEKVSDDGSELVLRYLLTSIGATSNMNDANAGLNVETNRIQIILDASPAPPMITEIDIEFRVTNIIETTNPITTASQTTIAPTTIPPTTIAPTTVSPMTTVTLTTIAPTTTVSSTTDSQTTLPSTSSAPSTTDALCDSTNSARIVRYWNFILK